MNRLFTISKDGNIYKNYKPQPINIDSIKQETDLIVERLKEGNVLEPSDEYKDIYFEEPIDPNKHYGMKDLHAWVQFLISQGAIDDPNDLDQHLAGLRMFLGDRTSFGYDEDEGITIEPAGNIKIPPVVHRKMMIEYYTQLRDKTPAYCSKKAIQEHLGGISLSSCDKLMKMGMPYVKLGGTRRVGFSKPAVERWINENA